MRQRLRNRNILLIGQSKLCYVVATILNFTVYNINIIKVSIFFLNNLLLFRDFYLMDYFYLFIKCFALICYIFCVQNLPCQLVVLQIAVLIYKYSHNINYLPRS